MKILLNNGEMKETDFNEQEGKKAFWHTSAHVLAQAVKHLYPETKCAIGPAIENGFYYDFDFAFSFTEEHLAEIEAEYIGADGEKHRPIMIHRVIFGSIERFIGILIEHYAGKFPVWLSPVQVKLLPVSDKYLSYANKILETLKTSEIRAELDTRDEKLGYKIREAQMDKVPYMVIIGEKEQKNHTVSVRQRDANIGKQDMGEMQINKLVTYILSSN